MKKTILALLLAGSGALGLGSVKTEAIQSSEDWKWLSEAFGQALGSLMPMDLPVRGVVAYRSHHELSLGENERHFVIVSAGGEDSFAATTLILEDASIAKQLLDRHMKDRPASVESVLSQIVFRREITETRRCPALLERMNALSSVAVRIPDRRLIMRGHPTRHRLVLDTSLLSMDVTIFDPANPLVRWAVDTYEALVSCAKSLLPSSQLTSDF
jgi:hypothetical protein